MPLLDINTRKTIVRMLRPLRRCLRSTQASILYVAQQDSVVALGVGHDLHEASFKHSHTHVWGAKVSANDGAYLVLFLHIDRFHEGHYVNEGWRTLCETTRCYVGRQGR